MRVPPGRLTRTTDPRTYSGRVTSPKTPLELAALATAAVPGLRVAGLRPPQFSDELVSVTGIIDVDGNRWMVTCPHDTVGGLDLEAQVVVLTRLATARDEGRLPFDVPRPRGFARTSDGARVMVHPDLGSRFMVDEDFSDPNVLPASMARALAALHNLPEGTYTNVDLPAYSAEECRTRNLALLDEAAQATVLPSNLWDRWEAALEDLSLWRFRAVPVHGDLQLTTVLVGNDCVTGMTGFSSAHVGDPATDVAWVLAQAGEEFLARFREAYSMARDATDIHVFTRAQLLSELALVRWLVHGVHAEDDQVVAEARQMLQELADDLGDEQLVRPTPSAPDQDGSALVVGPLRRRPTGVAPGGGSPESTHTPDLAIPGDGETPEAGVPDTGRSPGAADGARGEAGGVPANHQDAPTRQMSLEELRQAQS